MTTMRESSAEATAWKFTDRANAEAYVASVCFKHGPPKLLGIELEWTVHHRDDPVRPLSAAQLTNALGRYAPATLIPPAAPEDQPTGPAPPVAALPHGSLVTVEPGGQVEISVPPQQSLTSLLADTAADAVVLHALLREAGLVVGGTGCDAYRAPNRLLYTPRYTAMADAFEPHGTAGLVMMCSTAGVQVCLDVGEADQAGARWAALHALGPVLCAAYANSAQLGGRVTAWASARQRALFGTDPWRMRPSACTTDPAAAWARRVLDTPVICVRRPGDCWKPHVPMTFAEWIAGAHTPAPTKADLDYHLSTLFPPVRPRGYFEVRYLDAQPGEQWMAPAALLAAVMADAAVVDEVLAATEPATGRWLHAARHGLADPRIAEAARRVAAVAVPAMGRLDLPAHLAATLTDSVQRTLTAGRSCP